MRHKRYEAIQIRNINYNTWNRNLGNRPYLEFSYILFNIQQMNTDNEITKYKCKHRVQQMQSFKNEVGRVIKEYWKCSS